MCRNGVVTRTNWAWLNLFIVFLTPIGPRSHFAYDSSDRSVSIVEERGVANGIVKPPKTTVDYVRDVQGRIIDRATTVDGVQTDKAQYVFTGSGDSPDALLNAAGAITQKYVTLPGDVVLTIKPADTTPAGTTYSIPNIHGDVTATVNGDGTLAGTFLTGPFGEPIVDLLRFPGLTDENKVKRVQGLKS